MRFRTHSDVGGDTLPIQMRNVIVDGDTMTIGCRYEPTSGVHHRLVADLIFANSKQWTDFQFARRRNPGVIRGTLWFLWLSIVQTGRGLVYLFRSLRRTEALEFERTPAE